MERFPRARTVLIIFAALFGIYMTHFFGLGRNALVDPDEPIYGQYVKEMVRTGDWLTPHNELNLGFDKPPLFYWLSSACVKVAGLTEAAIRMPSAVFAVLIMLMVYLLASYDFGKKTGYLAAAIVATNLMQIIMSHAAATDEIMVFCMVAAIYFYRRWIDSEYPQRYYWISLCGIVTGLGMLAKGPVVPFLLLITFVAHLAWTHRLSRLKSFDSVLAILLFAAVGLPWYVAMYVMNGKAFVMQFIVGHNLTRFIQPLHKSQASHWYSHFNNLGYLLLLFFPWSPFLLQSIRHYWKANIGAKLCVCWLGIVLIFFSISKTQNFTYTLPVFPVCAILIAAYFSSIEISDHLKKSARIGFTIGCVLSILLGAGLVYTAAKKFPTAASVAAAAATTLALTFIVPAIIIRYKKNGFGIAPWLVVIGGTIFSVIGINLMLPKADAFLGSREIVGKIRALPKAEIISYKIWRPGLLFYLDTKPTDVEDAKDIAKIADKNQPALFICKDKDSNQIEAYLSKIFVSGNLTVYGNEALERAIKNEQK